MGEEALARKLKELHFWNLVFSIWFNTWIPIGDECRWYLVNTVTETTLGVAINIVLLQISMAIFKYDTGSYMSPEGDLMVRPWITQTGHWVLIISIMKVINAALIYFMRVPLSKDFWVSAIVYLR